MAHFCAFGCHGSTPEPFILTRPLSTLNLYSSFHRFDHDVAGTERRSHRALEIGDSLVVIGFRSDLQVSSVGQGVFALKDQEGCRTSVLIELAFARDLQLRAASSR